MSTPVTSALRQEIVYPDSDGEPLAENTVQYEWIVKIKGNLDIVFLDRPDVFVAGDLFWYPVEGDNKTRRAPDTMVVIGRPKGDRGSYMQWVENGIAPQVVFEVLSPSNRGPELLRKHAFYERFGVEEYYVYDPDDDILTGWLRRGDRLVAIPDTGGWVSPRLGIRFDTTTHPMTIYGPDDERFLTMTELGLRASQADAAVRKSIAAEEERDAAVQKSIAAEEERDAAVQKSIAVEAERDAAVQKSIAVEAERAAAVRERDLFLAKLRALGIEP